MTGGKRSDHNIMGTMVRALDLTEEALGEVARIAIEEIHSGLEASNHVQAAERDMRSALRQLVMAERELRSRSGGLGGHDQRPEGLSDAGPAPRSDKVRSSS